MNEKIALAAEASAKRQMEQLVSGKANLLRQPKVTNLMSELFTRDAACLADSALRQTKPNKASEPTTFAVTSRAIVRLTEMKQQNPNFDAARAAPAKVVAHL